MRATSLPTALPVATAAVALTAAVLAPLAAPSAALAERWLRPVPGDVARSFSYVRAAPFAAGAHRGVDLAAPPGTPVRAACAGRVVHAGAVAGRGEVVSVSCDGRRVSYLPLVTAGVRAGERIRAGAPIGTVARGHGGLHLGVRREQDPFAYEDPLALLPPPDAPFMPAAPPAKPRRAKPRRASPRRVTPRRANPRPVPPRLAPRPAVTGTPAAVTASHAHLHRPASPPAPWPVWGGLALVLSAAAGSGTIAVRRRRGRVRRAGATLEAAI